MEQSAAPTEQPGRRTAGRDLRSSWNGGAPVFDGLQAYPSVPSIASWQSPALARRGRVLDLSENA